MREPFKRIAMDIIGPLPRTRRGNQYILVVCDYATRYPEAVPLRSIDAGTVAEHLILLFSRVGIPKEILSDQGTNFMSQLLKELYNLLHISQLHTSPYHPQMDGLVERLTQTLKAMLRKFISKEIVIGIVCCCLMCYLHIGKYLNVPQVSLHLSYYMGKK